MLLVCRFTVPDAETAEFAARATAALEVLTAQAGCVRAVLGRSTDEAQRWVLNVEFASPAAYRRAMSPIEVRERVIPLLSLADDPATYEVLGDARDGRVEQRISVVASDAATVRPGEAAGPAVPRDPSR